MAEYTEYKLLLKAIIHLAAPTLGQINYINTHSVGGILYIAGWNSPWHNIIITPTTISINLRVRRPKEGRDILETLSNYRRRTKIEWPEGGHWHNNTVTHTWNIETFNPESLQTVLKAYKATQ